MSDAQTQPQTGAEKTAAEEGSGRLRAFSVGIGQLCKETGIPYNKLAEKAGVAPEALAPALVDTLAEAAAKEEKPAEQK